MIAFQRTITIVASPTTLTDFKLWFTTTKTYLRSPAFGGTVENVFNVGFYADAARTNPLDWEVESYNLTTGAVEYWIRIPTRTAGVPTVIYMAGDTSIVTDQSNPSGVFANDGFGTGFRLVQHYRDSAEQMLDSTMFDIQVATVGGPTAITGRLGAGMLFDGSTQYLEADDTQTMLQVTGRVQMSCWFYPTAFPSEGILIQRTPNFMNYQMGIDATGHLFGGANCRDFARAVSPAALTLNAWNFLQAGWDGIVFGASVPNYVALNTVRTDGPASYNSGGYSNLGNLIVMADQSPLAELPGRLDELRIHTLPWSQDEIDAEYLNQTDPDNYYTITGDDPPFVEDLCTTKEDPIIFVSVATPIDTDWFGQVDLPHDADYYGGFKSDRLLSTSAIKRSLAGPALDYQIGTFSIELADEDYAIREILVSSQGRYYSRWEIDAYMATPEGMANETEPLHIATGIVDTDPEFDTRSEAMTVRLPCRDRLGIAMGWTQTSQTKLPRRVLSNTTLPGVGTGMNGKAAWLPWGVLSNNLVVPSGLLPPFPNGIAARGSFADGPYWVAGYAPWTQTIAPVTNVIFSAVAGGDCPERDFSIQIFPVDANNNVGDPSPYNLGVDLVTSANPNRTMRADWTHSPDAVKYYVVMSAQYFGWLRPQQVIETTNNWVEFNHAPDFPNTPNDIATGATLIPNWAFNYYAARAKDGLFESQWHDVYDPALYPLQFAISFYLPNGKIRPVRLYWTPNGAPAYQVRKQAAGPFTPLIFNAPATSLESGLLYWDDDWNDADALPAPDPNLRLSGRVKVEFTRDVQLPDGNTWHELFIGGVPTKGVDNWYYDPGGDPSTVEMNQDDGTTFLFPKDGTAWDSIVATRFVDVIGTDAVTRRYTMGYAKAGTVKGDLIASGISIISVDLQGIEDVGDCSGDVITDLHDQLYHFLNQFVVASGEGYTSGLWGPVPTQGYDDLPIVNAESFEEVKAMRELEIPGGVVGAGITGALGELVDVSAELKRWMMSGDFRLGPNIDWQIVCRALDTSLSPLFVSNVLTDKYDIQNRTFKPKTRLSEQQNVFKWRSTRNYVTTGWLVNDQDYIDETSIANWRIRQAGEDLNFSYIESPGVVAHILGKHTARRVNAPVYAEFDGGLCQMTDAYDIGRYFNLTHWRGIGVGGWEDRVMWIISSTFDPETRRTKLECLDVTDLISSNAALLEGLMDIQLGGSWYNSPDLDGSDPITVDAFEFWDMRFPWSDFPDGTTLTARIWGMVPSGVEMTCELYDPDNLITIASDPTPFVGPMSDFSLHTFQLPTSATDLTYRLRAVVTGGSGTTVAFKGMLRPNLP